MQEQMALYIDHIEWARRTQRSQGSYKYIGKPKKLSKLNCKTNALKFLSRYSIYHFSAFVCCMFLAVSASMEFSEE
jgi:hypothetical protein